MGWESRNYHGDAMVWKKKSYVLNLVDHGLEKLFLRREE